MNAATRHEAASDEYAELESAKLGAAAERELTEEDLQTIERYKDFQQAHLATQPAYLRDVYEDSLLLNFHVMSWYITEQVYLFLFRMCFALVFFSVPQLTASVILWADLADEKTANVVQLLIVSLYTGPLLSRASSEILYLAPFIPVWRLVLIQADIPLVAALYVVSTAVTSHSGVWHFLASLGIAVPSFCLYVYLAYKRYTSYAYGFIGLYTYIPRLLVRNNFVLGRLPLTDRLRSFRSDLVGIVRAPIRVVTSSTRK